MRLWMRPSSLKMRRARKLSIRALYVVAGHTIANRRQAGLPDSARGPRFWRAAPSRRAIIPRAPDRTRRRPRSGDALAARASLGARLRRVDGHDDHRHRGESALAESA